MSACHGSELERRFSVFAAHTGAARLPHRGEPLRNVRRPARAWSLLAVLGSGRIYFFAAAAAGAVHLNTGSHQHLFFFSAFRHDAVAHFQCGGGDFAFPCVILCRRASPSRFCRRSSSP